MQSIDPDYNNCPDCGKPLNLVAMQNGHFFVCMGYSWVGKDRCKYTRPFDPVLNGGKLQSC